MKYIGVKNEKIQIVSDNKFHNPNLEILELPPSLENIDNNKLLLEYIVKNQEVIHKKSGRKSKDLKIALVANYGMNCGIATYSKFLYDELIPHIGEYKIFAEVFDNHPKESEHISYCWKRGESLSRLISEIKNYNPDVILIQHEWGLWHNSRQWLSMLSQLHNYRIICTMHSTFYHMDKLIVEASIPEMIVHLESAKNVLLNNKQISSKIYVIPHGCFLPETHEKLWNFYKTEYNFMQFGFLFRYKGYENSIKAVSLLKDKYPNIYFTGLCGESSNATLEHNKYYEDLIDLTNELKLQENVALIRGYQSETVLDVFLRMNKAAVFPYISNKGHECFGSSGAVPYAMAKQIPVITSNVHHFENLPTIKADSPEAIANELDKLFSNNNIRNNQINLQNSYLEANSWKKIAQLYLNVLEGNA